MSAPLGGPRVLETVLTGRNLLSPVLATAARDVTTYSSTVTAQQGKAAASAQTASTTQARAATTAAAATTGGSATQSAAAQKIAASNVKASTSAQASAQTQMRAHARAAESASLSARAQEAANRSLSASNGLLGSSLTPLTAGLGAIGLGLGYAAYRGMEFDAAMSQVQAASQASAGDMERLRDAAIDQGAKTKYSAEEAAQGITEMAKAGVSTADVLNGGLAGALNLAAAGQISVAEAAETGATALSVFSLKGDQMSHVADLLAAGAGKAQGSVGDMSAALNQSALVADQTGLSIEDTAGALAMFASNGLVGSDAGTSFKTMLQALTPNSDAASAAMDELGLRAYDAQGNFVGLEAYAGQLKDGLSGLTVEQQNATLKTIFGSDAVRAAAILYKEGSTGVRQWRDNVDDAGFAAAQAAANSDNLKGDLEKLGGAFDSAMTSIGGGLQGPLRGLTQGLTGILDAGSGLIGFFTDLPGSVQLAIGAFGLWSVAGDGLMGKLGPLKDSASGFFDTFTESLGYAKENGDGLTDVLGSMGEVGLDAAKGGLKALASAIGPELGIAAATMVASAAVDYILTIANAGDEARAYVEDMNDSLRETQGAAASVAATGEAINDMKDKIQEARDLVDAVKHDDLPFTPQGAAAKDAAASIEVYQRQLRNLELTNEQAETSTRALTERFNLSKNEVQELADKYEIDLSGAVWWTTLRFGEMYSKEYGTAPTDAANAFGAAVTSAKEQTEEAAKAQEEWLENLQNIADGFVEPLGAYTELLEEKKTKERESAEATAAATEDSSDSWEDYADDVTVSLNELATRLEEQLVAQDNWRQNIGEITQRGGIEVGQILAGMGEEGVQLAAQMANGTDAEFQRMAGLLIEDARRAGSGAAAALDQEMKVMAAVGVDGAGKTAAGIAAQLNMGVGEVLDIAGRYGVNLAAGINPVLVALGRDQVRTNARIAGGATVNSLGGGQLWDGGYTGDGGKYEPKGVVHGGEFVFTKEQTSAAGIAQLEAYANSLSGYATGGFVTSGDVPRPYSTAPKGPPISTAGDATMQKGFDEVRAWMEAHQEATQGGTAGAGAVTGAWGSLWQLVKGQIPQARINSTYRAGDPGYHGKGKAIDFGFGSGPGGAGSAGLASINRLLHDQVGASIAQLIYDGSGDDRPDLLMGRPHNYGASTQAEHRNHVHAAVRDSGGLVPTGTAGLNLSGRDERVLSPRQTEAFERWMNSPAAMPGYGAAANGGGAGTTTVINSQITFAGPVYGGEAMRRIAEDVVQARDRQLRINGRSR